MSLFCCYRFVSVELGVDAEGSVLYPAQSLWAASGPLAIVMRGSAGPEANVDIPVANTLELALAKPQSLPSWLFLLLSACQGWKLGVHPS